MHVDRYTTPAGDRREWPVRCNRCWGSDTFAMDAVCDRCHARECTHPTDLDGIPLCWLAKEAADA